MKNTACKKNLPFLTIQRIYNSPLLPSRANLESWVSTALTSETSPREVNIRIVAEKEMQVLNETYRHKKGVTNILSFAFNPPLAVNHPLLGDLILCGPVIRREALSQKKTLSAHWAHLVIHGCLHLLGYDHQVEEAAQIMENLEIKLLAELGFSNPYIFNHE